MDNNQKANRNKFIRKAVLLVYIRLCGGARPSEKTIKHYIDLARKEAEKMALEYECLFSSPELESNVMWD